MDEFCMGAHGVRMAPKHSFRTLHVLMGSMFKVSVASASKLVLGYPPKLDMFQWMVGLSFRFQVTCFKARRFQVLKSMSNCCQNMTCFDINLLGVCNACALKLTSNRFEMSNTFMTC